MGALADRLEHSGVKGMKWGSRKSKKSGSPVGIQQKAVDRKRIQKEQNAFSKLPIDLQRKIKANQRDVDVFRRVATDDRKASRKDLLTVASTANKNQNGMFIGDIAATRLDFAIAQQKKLNKKLVISLGKKNKYDKILMKELDFSYKSVYAPN